MATRTVTDRGADQCSITIDRRGADATAEVLVETDAGRRNVNLSKAELGAALTAGERTALVSALQKLYAAALAKEGFGG